MKNTSMQVKFVMTVTILILSVCIISGVFFWQRGAILLGADEIRFTGIITEIDTSCSHDGICKVKVGPYWIITDGGGDPLVDPNKKMQFGPEKKIIGVDGKLIGNVNAEQLGNVADVFGKKNDVNDVTIVGSSKYYLRLYEKPRPVIFKITENTDVILQDGVFISLQHSDIANTLNDLMKKYPFAIAGKLFPSYHKEAEAKRREYERVHFGFRELTYPGKEPTNSVEAKYPDLGAFFTIDVATQEEVEQIIRILQSFDFVEDAHQSPEYQLATDS